MIVHSRLPIPNETTLSTELSVNDGQLQSVDSREKLFKALNNGGAALLRGHGIHGEVPFDEFIRAFGGEPLTYEFCSTPRTKLRDGVYTSTEYPADQAIPLHNENSYTRNWPRFLWFHCVAAAKSGGQTPLADSREVLTKIDPAIRACFEKKQLRYVRNYDGMYDLPWQKVFGTENKRVVEDYCRSEKVDFTWKADGTLQTYQICQATAVHPVTEEVVWFNQAHLFHVSNMGRELKEAMLDVFGSSRNLPRNVFYGDGTEIEESILDEIRGVLTECETIFDWQDGDILAVDNMLVAHGRRPFEGDRKVLVAMTEAHKG